MELLRDALDANFLTCINQVVMNWLENLFVQKTGDFGACWGVREYWRMLSSKDHQSHDPKI